MQHEHFRIVVMRPIKSGGVVRQAGDVLAAFSVTRPSDLALIARALRGAPALRILRTDGQPIGPEDVRDEAPPAPPAPPAQKPDGSAADRRRRARRRP